MIERGRYGLRSIEVVYIQGRKENELERRRPEKREGKDDINQSAGRQGGTKAYRRLS